MSNILHVIAINCASHKLLFRFTIMDESNITIREDEV